MSKSTRRRRNQAQSKKKAQTDTTTQTLASPRPEARPEGSVERAVGQQTTKANQKQTDQDRTLREAWRNQPTKLILIVFLSVAVAIYVGWKIANPQQLGQTVVWGAIAGASIWVAFYASYRFNRWIRRR